MEGIAEYVKNMNNKNPQLCSVKGRNSKASIVLKVKFVNKVGSFCSSCADYCLKEGLAVHFVGDEQ